jgi:hypothetical protein
MIIALWVIYIFGCLIIFSQVPLYFLRLKAENKVMPLSAIVVSLAWPLTVCFSKTRNQLFEIIGA